MEAAEFLGKSSKVFIMQILEDRCLPLTFSAHKTFLTTSQHLFCTHGLLWSDPGNSHLWTFPCYSLHVVCRNFVVSPILFLLSHMHGVSQGSDHATCPGTLLIELLASFGGCANDPRSVMEALLSFHYVFGSILYLTSAGSWTCDSRWVYLGVWYPH